MVEVTEKEVTEKCTCKNGVKNPYKLKNADAVKW